MKLIKKVETKNRIVLHVGAPKTGTTFIQKSLQQDSKYCRKSGVYVPEDTRIQGVAGNAKLVALSFRNGCHETFNRRFHDIDLAQSNPADALNVLCSGWTPEQEALFLSAEYFHANDAPLLRGMINEDIDVSIVLFIRRQDRWVQSWHNQLTKSASITSSIEDFVYTIGREEDELLGSADWLKTYQVWRNTFGDCRVCIFDEVLGNLLKAFLRASNLPSLPKLKKQSPKQVSLNSYELAYLLEIRPDVSYEDFILHRKACIIATSLIPEIGKYSFLSPEVRDYLVKLYNPRNKELMALLNRHTEWPILQIPQVDPSYIKLSDFRNTEAYRAFRKLTSEQYSKIVR
jgi:hypothetical protein